MTTRIPQATPPVAEQPVDHAELDRAFIGRLVRTSYGSIRQDERFGPIFAKMTDFWCSVMLKDGSYQGRPVPAHLKLKTVVEGDFAIWLRLFGETARELCSPDVADAFVKRAERIATSLKLAMFFLLPVAK